MAADSPPSSGAIVKPQAAADFFATEGHYRSLAGRIAATFSGGRFVLVTGDPPASPEMLCRALFGEVAEHHEAVSVLYPPKFEQAELLHGTSTLAAGSLSGGATGAGECSSANLTLFILAKADGLSDAQIEHICESTLLGAGMSAMGVVLARPGFLARLEGPALSFLKERLVAHYRLQEVGDDERLAYLRYQLARQRQRRTNRSRFRVGALLSLASLGIVLTMSIGAFLWVSPSGIPIEVKSSEARSGDVEKAAEAVSAPQSAASEVTNVAPAEAPAAEPAATSPTTVPPPPVTAPPVEMPVETAPVAAPAPVQSPVGRLPSKAETSALVTRGDGFLSQGDVASARLFYERAADAGDGRAALRLGETFDAAFLGRDGVRGIRGDPDQAMSWYRRARQLGEPEAEQRLRSLETWLHLHRDAQER